MLALDAPKLWRPQKPAIIRPAREVWRPPVQYQLRRGFMPGITPVIANKRAKSVTFIGTSLLDTNATTYNFNNGGAGLDFSAAAADRYIIVMASGQNQTRTLSGVTIGGVGSSVIDTLQVASSTGALVIANVPTGDTGTISVTWSAGQFGCGIAWWVAYGLSSATPVDNGAVEDTSNSATISGLASVAGGFVIAGLAAAGNQVSAAYAWTGVNERYDEVFADGRNHSGGDNTTTGAAVSVSCTETSGNGFAMFVATF